MTKYIEKWENHLISNDYVSIIADGISVSTFLCTWKLRPEEVSTTAV